MIVFRNHVRTPGNVKIFPSGTPVFVSRDGQVCSLPFPFPSSPVSPLFLSLSLSKLPHLVPLSFFPIVPHVRMLRNVKMFQFGIRMVRDLLVLMIVSKVF